MKGGRLDKALRNEVILMLGLLTDCISNYSSFNTALINKKDHKKIKTRANFALAKHLQWQCFLPQLKIYTAGIFTILNL